MKKKTWDLYAPIYKKAMQADQKIYDFMYERIPVMIRDMEVLEIATGPGLLAKHVAPAAKRMIATDYSDGMIAEAKKGDCPANLTFEVADAMNLPYADHSFDAVIASPMDRAVETASIISGLSRDDIIKDKRIREFGFGKFENVEYSKMGPAMSLYWMFPELFPGKTPPR